MKAYLKKLLCVLMCIVFIAGCTGCGRDKSSAVADTAGSSGEITADNLNDNTPQAIIDIDDDTVLSTTEGIDIDLTSLSSTMVYSEVYNMMYEPEKFIGKTVRMNGTFMSYHDEDTGKYYFACIVQDATACCAQGIEFVLTDDYTYPDDYPKEEGDITVTGVFQTYTEGEDTYCHLVDADIL